MEAPTIVSLFEVIRQPVEQTGGGGGGGSSWFPPRTELFPFCGADRRQSSSSSWCRLASALTAARTSWGTTWGEAASSWSSWQAWYWRVRFLSRPPSYPDDHGSFGEAGTMPSSCASPRRLLEEFPVLCARAVRTWNLVHFSVDFVPGSHCSGRLGVTFENGKLDFTGDVCFRGCNTWFDSGYTATVLWWLWTNCTHFPRCGRLES